MDVKINRITRVTKKIRIDENGCWIWTGRKNGAGYGVLFGRNQENKPFQTGVHRWLYQVTYGIWLTRKEYCDHLCRTPACVNPKHIEIVDNRTNIIRGVGPVAENAAKTHCKRGHPFDKENTAIDYCNGKPGRHCKACRKITQRRRLDRLKAAQC